MKTILSIILYTLFAGLVSIQAQELNMKITVNSDRIQGTDKSTFDNLQDVLTQFANGRKWTDVTFNVNERIECSMLITLSEKNDNSYKAEIQVISNRPVYNSSYMTPMFSFKDVDFNFDYLIGQNIEFNESNIDNNLTATIAFYIYIILGIDFDSFSLGGGKIYFDRAMSIATSAQTLGSEKGWAAFGSDRNRYALALSLTEESTASSFHNLWYNYHRKGLDEMAANATRGRTEIENAIPNLQKIYQSRPASPILLFFGDTKLDEVVNIYSKASLEEKQAAYKILSSIYPTRRYTIDNLKN